MIPRIASVEEQYYILLGLSAIYIYYSNSISNHHNYANIRKMVEDFVIHDIVQEAV